MSKRDDVTMLKQFLGDALKRKLDPSNPRRKDFVQQLMKPRPPIVELLEALTPQERLEWLNNLLNTMILMTPTGVERAAMSEANIRVMCGMESSGQA